MVGGPTHTPATKQTSFSTIHKVQSQDVGSHYTTKHRVLLKHSEASNKMRTARKHSVLEGDNATERERICAKSHFQGWVTNRAVRRGESY